MNRVPPTRQERPDRLYVFPCGCVTRDHRGGPVVQDCTAETNPDVPGGRLERDCYRRNAPRVRRVGVSRPRRVDVE